MSVRYKFKNDLEYGTLPCDGFHISVRDLKRAIVRAKKLGRVTDFDLKISNSQTGEAYENDEDLIPKNSALVIARHPLPSGQKKTWEDEKLPAPSMTSNKASSGPVGAAISGGSFSNSAGKSDGETEEDKISAMMSSSSEMYDQKNWVRYKGRGGAYSGKAPPKTYRCIKCQQTGHWHQDCRQQRHVQNIPKTTGIPSTFLTPADPQTPGVKRDLRGKTFKATDDGFQRFHLGVARGRLCPL